MHAYGMASAVTHVTLLGCHCSTY